MPNRMLRDWTDSEKVHILSAEAERFFTRLIMKCDDYGRYYGSTKLLRAYLFPLHVRLKEEKVGGWLAECVSAGLVNVYDVNSKTYLEIHGFDQKLKVRRSKYPPSDPDERESLKEGYIYVVGSGFDQPVKIGFSVNPWARLKEISVHHPGELKVLLSIKADKKFETLIHKTINELRVRAEWFKLNKGAINCLTALSKNEIDRDEAIVELRSCSSLLRSGSEYEYEVEVEYEVEKERKGAVAPVPTTSAPPSQEKIGKMKEKQDAMRVRSKTFSDSLVPFVAAYGKEMIRAFFDHWSEPNKSRTKMKFEMEDTWDVARRLVTWETRDIRWNKGVKGAPGVATKAEKPAPALSKLQLDVNYLYERYMEAPDQITVISLGGEHYNLLKTSGLLSFTAEESTSITKLATGYMAENKIEATPASELLFKKKFAVLEYFKQLKTKGQATIFYLIKAVDNEAV